MYSSGGSPASGVGGMTQPRPTSSRGSCPSDTRRLSRACTCAGWAGSLRAARLDIEALARVTISRTRVPAAQRVALSSRVALMAACHEPANCALSVGGRRRVIARSVLMLAAAASALATPKTPTPGSSNDDFARG